MINKKVSVVLPVYNGKTYLRDSIESVIMQTYSNWELIIVNDASIDSSPKIIEEYAKKDFRIKVYHNKENQGLPKSLNIGFSKATGDYYTWTSDDNMYKPRALEVMAGYLSGHENVDLVYANYTQYDVEKGIEKDIKVSDPNLIFMYDVVGACFMYRSNIIQRVGEYDPEFRLVEDYEFFIRCALKCKLQPIDENLYFYRMHNQNLSSKFKDNAKVMHEKAVLTHINSLNGISFANKYPEITSKAFIHLYMNERFKVNPRLRLDLLAMAWKYSKWYVIKSLPKLILGKTTRCCLLNKIC